LRLDLSINSLDIAGVMAVMTRGYASGRAPRPLDKLALGGLTEGLLPNDDSNPTPATPPLRPEAAKPAICLVHDPAKTYINVVERMRQVVLFRVLLCDLLDLSAHGLPTVIVP